jgi:hypothetical protein
LACPFPVPVRVSPRRTATAAGRVSAAVLATLVTLVTLAGALSACSCPQTTVLVDDFENCSGACGWAVSGAGTATVVSTILPGEHGLRIDGGVTASKSIPSATIDTTYSLQLVAACPDGLAASLTVTVPGSPDATVAVMLAEDSSLTSNGDPPDYTGASFVPLVGSIDLPTGVMSGIVTQVVLQPVAGAPCTVDLIELTAVTPCNAG